MTGMELLVMLANLLIAGWIWFGKKEKRGDGAVLTLLVLAVVLHAAIDQFACRWRRPI